MDHIEQCIAELRVLKRILKEKDREIEALKTQGPRSSSSKQLTEEVRRYKAENKALKESLRCLSEKRKQDREIIAKWQVVLQDYKERLSQRDNSQRDNSQRDNSQERETPTNSQQRDVPTDETRLESSPPHKSVTSLTMESICEGQDGEEDGEEDGDVTLVKEEPKDLEVVKVVGLELDPVDLASVDLAPMDPANPADLETPAKRPHIQVSIDTLLARDWHPSDFMINPVMNEGISHAYHEKILGKARTHLDCSDCPNCKKFQTLTGKKLETSSRHRELWKKQNTPPGFWRSGFDTAAESLDRHLAEESTRTEALERLKHAISGGKYLFKDNKLRELAEKGLIR